MNPADNPAEVDRARDKTTDDDSTTMKGQDDPTDDSRVAENTEGTEWDLREMSTAHVDGNKYRVLSTRNETINHYLVNVEEGTCDCPSEEYNLQENEACPHLTKALLVAKSQMDHADMHMRDIQVFSERSRNLLWELRDAVDFASTLAENNAKEYRGDDATPSESKPDTTSNTTGDSGASMSEPSGPNPMDKREELQAAFDDVIDDMQTEVAGGMIWIQTGKDTPDTIPGPGNVEVFNAFLKDPDAVTFVHDDHRLDSERPGQWWKNAIDPSDVDSYIAEVLR